MGPPWLSILLASIGCVAAAAAGTGWVWRTPGRRSDGPGSPRNRPLEAIAHDARRLGARFRNPPRGTSFAKLEAVRYAYDHVLSEACAALEVEHLLGVLPAGEELDAERTRVESVLWLAGLRIEEAA